MLLLFFFGGELGSHLRQYGLGQGLPLYQAASRSIQPFGHNRRRVISFRHNSARNGVEYQQ